MPEPHFLLGDALAALGYLQPVDVFFLRRDSGGEGGSELFLLCREHLPISLKVLKPGGLLVTDRINISSIGPVMDSENRHHEIRTFAVA